MLNIEGYWDIVITSLQDIYNSNESTTFENTFQKYLDDEKNIPNELETLKALKQQIIDHSSNIQTSTRLIETCQQNLLTLISNLQKQTGENNTINSNSRQSRSNSVIPKNSEKKSPSASSPTTASNTTKPSSNVTSKTTSSTTNAKKQKKVGRLYYASKYNMLEPVIVGSEVAYKLKNRHTEEWIQCEVTKVIGDGVKFEVRDPEPDENNNPGQTFKANFKEIILINPRKQDQQFPNYPYGYKVLARYPETTTFYPAVVVGTKKDGGVRLKFDGEEEANKETEVPRRLVLPFPEK